MPRSLPGLLVGRLSRPYLVAADPEHGGYRILVLEFSSGKDIHGGCWEWLSGYYHWPAIAARGMALCGFTLGMADFARRLYCRRDIYIGPTACSWRQGIRGPS